MRKVAAVIAGLLSALTLWADPTIRVEVHNIVELSERFNVVFVVEGEHAPSDFEWNAGDDFTTVWGPQKGTSTLGLQASAKCNHLLPSCSLAPHFLCPSQHRNTFFIM